LLKPDVHKLVNVYISGTVAMRAEVLFNQRMHRGILIEFRE